MLLISNVNLRGEERKMQIVASCTFRVKNILGLAASHSSVTSHTFNRDNTDSSVSPQGYKGIYLLTSVATRTHLKQIIWQLTSFLMPKDVRVLEYAHFILRK